MRYHPFIFAPDENDPDGGPTVLLERSPLPPLGVQSTLPAEDKPVLLNAQGEAFPTPRRLIGFGR